MSFLSIFSGTMFYIDADNVYHRGSLFLLMAIICYALLVYTMIKAIARHRQMKRKNFIPILIFAIPPFLAGILQTLFFGLSLIWVAMTVSILIVFLNIQYEQLHTDYLTGVFNRRQLASLLKQKAQLNQDKINIAGIMLDLDSFKLINDQYGHDAGDKALISTADILKKTFRKTDVIIRYGGDEFIVLMETNDETVLEKSVERLIQNLARFNAEKHLPFEISLSIGYDLYKPGSGISDFMRHIDQLMYRDKP